MVTGRAHVQVRNSSFFDNVAGTISSGSGAGGAMAAYSADLDVRVKQQWASGAWGCVFICTCIHTLCVHCVCVCVRVSVFI